MTEERVYISLLMYSTYMKKIIEIWLQDNCDPSMRIDRDRRQYRVGIKGVYLSSQDAVAFKLRFGL
jgi:hypothetical protein